MYQTPITKMVCDSDRGNGGVYFYEEYFEWVGRGTASGFRIHYKDIVDIKVLLTHKKRVTVILRSGESRNLYTYKYDNLVKFLKDGIERSNEANVVDVESKDVKPEEKEDDLSKLERLAKLHNEGALTDEEFAKAKEKILG